MGETASFLRETQREVFRDRAGVGCREIISEAVLNRFEYFLPSSHPVALGDVVLAAPEQLVVVGGSRRRGRSRRGRNGGGGRSRRRRSRTAAVERVDGEEAIGAAQHSRVAGAAEKSRERSTRGTGC